MSKRGRGFLRWVAAGALAGALALAVVPPAGAAVTAGAGGGAAAGWLGEGWRWLAGLWEAVAGPAGASESAGLPPLSEAGGCIDPNGKPICSQ